MVSWWWAGCLGFPWATGGESGLLLPHLLLSSLIPELLGRTTCSFPVWWDVLMSFQSLLQTGCLSLHWAAALSSFPAPWRLIFGEFERGLSNSQINSLAAATLRQAQLQPIPPPGPERTRLVELLSSLLTKGPGRQKLNKRMNKYRCSS